MLRACVAAIGALGLPLRLDSKEAEMVAAVAVKEQIEPSPASSLPADLKFHRMLSATQAAEMSGYTLRHWRRLYSTGKAPAPKIIGANRVGWKAGDLIAWLEARPEREVTG
jgi:predicted DNA-binding transcriptional regulator AlpA